MGAGGVGSVTIPLGEKLFPLGNYASGQGKTILWVESSRKSPDKSNNDSF